MMLSSRTVAPLGWNWLSTVLMQRPALLFDCFLSEICYWAA
jgi:hypothetical protein